MSRSSDSEIGQYYYSCTPPNWAQAILWFKSAIEKGDYSCCDKLTHIFSEGENGIAIDYDEMFRYATISDSHGSYLGTYNLGRCYQHGFGTLVNRDRALLNFRKAADADFPFALWKLGILYFIGFLVARNNDMGFLYTQRAATLGFRDAQTQLGSCYLHGIGTPVDSKRALEHLQLAADKDCSIAAQHLGVLYENGGRDGVIQRNYTEAIKWYNKSGTDKSQLGLIRCLRAEADRLEVEQQQQRSQKRPKQEDDSTFVSKD